MSRVRQSNLLPKAVVPVEQAPTHLPRGHFGVVQLIHIAVDKQNQTLHAFLSRQVLYHGCRQCGTIRFHRCVPENRLCRVSASYFQIPVKIRQGFPHSTSTYNYMNYTEREMRVML